MIARAMIAIVMIIMSILISIAVMITFSNRIVKRKLRKTTNNGCAPSYI